ncbi:hypothetical protein NCCP2716_00990 [Sporosarcina sp. NCCP-2716]|uniref:hypothetical protein n=1 Tax=Sporosarcina sp. NCCP-2716 TaxID=2943679 RepID=UPI00203C8685|nr:hypothetical protein [Sporosarcina sp. NCCP-2716]GKV67601.1 hypothetical protein NCCP2716_00990 [Sporosarcina sp. NCCP-2716]
MKWIKRLFAVIIVFAVVIAAAYYFGTNWLADKAMNEVTSQLESSGQLDEVKSELNSNADVQAYLQDAKTADRSKLPIKTKEQATRAVLKKFSVSELADMQQKAQSGMTEAEQQELLRKVESRLTPEELLSLKVLALDELSK